MSDRTKGVPTPKRRDSIRERAERVQGWLAKLPSISRTVRVHRPHLIDEPIEKPLTGHHGRTPETVLNAPRSVPVRLTYESAGYQQAPDGSLRRTTKRRGKKVKRHG